MGLAAPFAGVYQGRRVLVTGHTGFKGAWLAFWLKELGAEVVGFALPPETSPSLYAQLKLAGAMDSRLADLGDEALARTLKETRPEIVFHLAAQSLVRRSYEQPERTFETNVMGTVRLLEAVRQTDSVRVCVVVTSDKCYENESGKPCVETAPLGGADPYSASKACAELVVASYRRSFFAAGARVSLSSARAGNVIGGGDWAQDRILPDCARALAAGLPVDVRNPGAVRPWQHVLEPLAGYLLLASRQWEQPGKYAEAWNFGPDTGGDVTVAQLAALAARHWDGGSTRFKPDDGPAEAPCLRLDSLKARRDLGWRPVYTTEQAVAKAIAWYRRAADGAPFDAAALTRAQLNDYVAALPAKV